MTPKVISYAGETGSGFVPVLSLGGLTLEAACAGGPGPFLQVRANPAVANSEISSSGAFTNTDTDFDPGDNFLLADNPSNGTLFIAFAGADGKVVTAQALDAPGHKRRARHHQRLRVLRGRPSGLGGKISA